MADQQPQEPKSIRAAFRELIDQLTPDTSVSDRRAIERRLMKTCALRLMADGYAMAGAAEVIGVPESTLRTWRDKDPAFEAALANESTIQRNRLNRVLWLKAESMEKGTPGSGQAITILSNLHHPELRHSKVETTVQAPDPEQAKARMLDRVNRGKKRELGDTI